MSVVLSHNIEEALQTGGPVVALETAVLTKGLPHVHWGDQFGNRPAIVAKDTPINVAAARAMTDAVENAGAIPAWIALINGSLRIGLSQIEVEELALDKSAGKVSLATIASVMAQHRTAGTTVATTLQACNLVRTHCGHSIKVFATGGIGGIHRNWSSHFDISADLRALATTPTCVVASGAKSILDVAATVESLETLGVPILGFRNDRFPCFIESQSQNDPQIHIVDSVEEVVKICNVHWNQLESVSGVLTTCQPPEEVAIKRGTLEKVIDETEKVWGSTGEIGATRTPALLDALAHHTQGRSIVANLALLCNNASIAGEIAVAMRNTS